MDRITAAVAARKVIEAYVDGSRRGDAALLRSIFHPTAVMTGYFGGRLLAGPPEAFFASVEKQGPTGPAYAAEITGVEVDGRIATVTLVETGFAGHDFIDRFHLVEEGGRWLIVSKLFHHD